VSAAEDRLATVAIDLSESVSIENLNYSPGAGVSAKIDGKLAFLGSATWLEQHSVEFGSDRLSKFISQHESEAESVLFLAVGGEFVGAISLADSLRSGVSELLQRLREQGATISMLSGDRRSVAEATAKKIGGDIEVIAEVLPKQKAEEISRFQQQGVEVAMVGDGVNDAPALTVADVGIALGSGTDVSVESADIVLLSSELEQVELANRLSRQTLRTIRQNIGISILYNIVMVPLAMMAFITPLVAAVAMPISSLLVIGNAARLRRVVK
jgi:Cu2+-exporting ATPase